MVIQKQVLRIIVASPNDVQAERDSLEEIATELNRGIAADYGLVIEFNRWETDAYPGFHDLGPQGLIDSILRIEDCDLLIGIFWKHFGTPVADAKSGTEHEFRIAYEAWKRNKRPQIMVYFNQRPYTPKSRAEIEQWSQVLDFKSNFPKEGLWWPYKGKAQFEKLVRNHLTQFLRHRASTSRSLSSTEHTHIASTTTASNPISDHHIMSANYTEEDFDSYLRFVESQCATLDPRRMPRSSKTQEIVLPLRDVFITLKAGQNNPLEREAEQNLLDLEVEELIKFLRLTDREADINENDFRYQKLAEECLMLSERLREKLSAVKLHEVFCQKRWLVILGEPGSGKTTLMQWLALQFARALHAKESRVRHCLGQQ